MGEVINFPSVVGNDLFDVVREMDRETKIIKACRAMLEVMRRGTIDPEKFFLMYQEGDACAYINIGYSPDLLVKSIDLVLEHGLKDEC